jgi:putative spermidine/putrescine transport system permease protein
VPGGGVTAPGPRHVLGERGGRRGWAVLAAPGVLFVVLLYLVPIAGMLVQSVTSPEWGLENFRRLFSTRGYVDIGFRTLWIAGAATGVSLILGYPVAYAITTSGPVVSRLLLIGVVSPYLMSTLVRTFAWQVLLGRLGPVIRLARALGLARVELLFTPIAVIVGLVHLLLPLMILPLVSVMQQVDRNLVRSAASVGAGPAQTFFRVFLPLTTPGIEVGCLLAFVYGVGAFVTPQLLGGQAGTMLGVIIQNSIDQLADFGFASAVAVVLSAVVFLVLAVYRWCLGGSLRALAGAGRGGAGAAPSGRILPGRARSRPGARFVLRLAGRLDAAGLSRSRAPLLVWSFAVVAYLFVPQLVAIPVSFSPTATLIFPPTGFSTRWYVNFLSPGWLSPAVTSVGVALPVATLATTMGGLAAAAVARGLSGRWVTPVTLLMILPLLLPTVVAGAAFYLAFIGVGLTDSALGLILAHTSLGIPFAFVILEATVRSVDAGYERAAASLGARRWTILRRILVPLIRPGVVIALFLTFLMSFDEAVVAIFLSGVHVKTLPRRMFEALAHESDPTIGVVATLSLLVAFSVLFGSARLRRALVRPR